MTTEPTDLRAFHASRIAELRANGGKLNPPLDTVPLLVLTTIGARSGRPHAMPMSYTRDGDRIVVIAAAGGAPTHPAWYHNLLANPEVTVEVTVEVFRGRAVVTTGEERARLFTLHTAQRPNFVEFQQRAARQLPVIVIERSPE